MLPLKEQHDTEHKGIKRPDENQDIDPVKGEVHRLRLVKNRHRILPEIVPRLLAVESIYRMDWR
jgi:hypothetical protein